LEHPPRNPDHAAVLVDLDPELRGLAASAFQPASSGKVENMAAPVALWLFEVFSKRSLRGLQRRNGQSLGPAPPPRYARPMCGRVRFSSDVSEIKLVFSIPPHRPTPNFAPTTRRQSIMPGVRGYVVE
jgi:hypothetical protein